MKLKISTQLLLAAVLVLAMHVAVETAAAEDVGNNRLREQGVIHSVDRSAAKLVIGDSEYAIDKSTRVYARDGKSLPIDVLRSGTKIRYSLTLAGDKNQRVIVKDILLLGGE